jgi:hypothetical protein
MLRTRSGAGVCALGLAVAMVPLADDAVNAADHRDAPNTKTFVAADITDVYAWHTDDQKIVAVLNFAGFTESGMPAVFDSTILYGLHIDNTGDYVADQDVWIRFGQNGVGDWGVQISGLPGGEPVVVGPVETILDAGSGLRAWAGLRDDPFFFDFEGFTETITTSALAFDSTRDSFAMTNVSSIVVEMATAAAAPDDPVLHLWASTRVQP